MYSIQLEFWQETDGTFKRLNCREITEGLFKGVWTGFRELTKDGKVPREPQQQETVPALCLLPETEPRRSTRERKVGVTVSRV